MSIVILDLEWTSSYLKNEHKYLNEIIEFGAVKLDNDLNIIDEFSCLVKPKYCKSIKGFVKRMTNISNEELFNNGHPFDDVVKEFKKWSKGSIICTWSKSDVYALIDNFEAYYNKKEVNFLKKYLDVQEYVQKKIKQSGLLQLSLQSAAELLDIDVNCDKSHRAVYDSEVTTNILKACYDKELFNRLTFNVDKKFYKKLYFKPYIIKSPKDKTLDNKSLEFNCEKCNSPLVKKSKWNYKNKYLTSVQYCKKCKINYTTRVQAKKQFDRVDVKRTISINSD